MNETLALHIADDHEVVRVALRHALAPLAERLFFSESADAATTRAVLSGLQAAGTMPAVALLDFHMPGVEGTSWFAALIRDFPALRVIVISGGEDPATVRELLAHGAAGFIPKTDSTAVILEAVRLVLAGGRYAPPRLLDATPAQARSGATAPAALTGHQMDVLGLLAKGMPNKLIARELGLSEGTVKVHLLAIFRALAVRNRTEAVIAAARWLELPRRG